MASTYRVLLSTKAIAKLTKLFLKYHGSGLAAQFTDLEHSCHHFLENQADSGDTESNSQYRFVTFRCIYPGNVLILLKVIYDFDGKEVKVLSYEDVP